MSVKLKSDRFSVIMLALILMVAIAFRFSLIFATPGFATYYGVVTPIGDAARNLAEGRGYAVDWEYVTSITSRMEKENKYRLIDIQDMPPPLEEHLTPYYYFPPGPSALLAATYLVTGENRYNNLRYLQAIIDAFGCIISFLLGRELLSRRAGLIAAFLYAVWRPIAHVATWPLQDALMPFITLVALYFFVLGVKRKSILFYALSGLAVGVGCYFQPSIMLLPIVFGIALFVYDFRKREFRKQFANWAKVTVVMMAAVVIVISPWVVRNYRVTGGWVGMRPGVWSGIWEGFGEFGQNPVGAQLSDSATYELATRELGHDIDYMSPQYQAFFKAKVFNAIEEHPVWWTGLLARRMPKAIFYYSRLAMHTPVGDMWHPKQTVTEVTKEGNFWDEVKSHPVTLFYIMPGYVIFILSHWVVFLALFGIWVIRKNWRTLGLILTAAVYFAAVNIVMFTAAPKSIMPGSITYVILCAVAVDYFYARIKGKGSLDLTYAGAPANS